MSGERPELRPATKADIADAFRNIYGESREIPTRILALTGSVGGRTICVGGIAFWPNGARQAFCDISDEGRQYPKSLHRGAKTVLDMAKRMGVGKVIVVQGPDTHEKTPNWLRHLGFARQTIDGRLVYVWSR